MPPVLSPSDSSIRLESALDDLPAIGIIRGCPPPHLVAIAAAAADAGLTVVEVTLDSEDALEGIAAVSSELPHVVVGAGTVHTPSEVADVAAAGAAFVVSPSTSSGVIAACLESGLTPIPGAATPTEIVHARELGAWAVKVFPAVQLGGPGYVRALMSPLLSPRLVPTGGVDLANAKAYLSAGARAVGLGGSIFTPAAMAEADTDAIGAAVRSLRKALQ